MAPRDAADGSRPDSVLAAALVAARAAAAEEQARVRAAAAIWARERDAADALARQIVEAEQLLASPASPVLEPPPPPRRDAVCHTPPSYGTIRLTRS
jgi:hypothetical protein